ncbi:YeeE/YedE thiosulfate transporter family protein [Methanoregula sp.]|uniref:YeeE/YedE thiosulfate transporter family protein n=1 Tax=Methanoregula sp. TaxID=2052170 RepID=UPI003C70CBA5
MTMAEQTRVTASGRIITGLLIGIAFGILLYEGGLANYDVIEGQLQLADFTFLKILLSAMIVATIGFFVICRAGLAERKTMQPSLGTHLAGGLIMGAGFALLGYGPASVLSAAGAGYPDALAGLLGILSGAGLFARSIYPRISRSFLGYGKTDRMTLPGLFRMRESGVVVLVCVVLLFVLWIITIKST